MSVSSLLKRFRVSRRGNVAMMTALMLVPLLGLLGGAVDLVRMNQTRSEIQGVIDSGVLAISEINNKNDPQKTIEQFIKAGLRKSNLDPDSVKLDVKVTDRLNGKNVDVNASYVMKTHFLGVIGFDELDIAIRSSGTQTYADIEIAVVLDISGSMNGTKFTNMQAAAKDFIDAVLIDDMKDQTTISIIPFSSNVNVGDQFWEYVDKNTVDNDHDTNFWDGHIWDGCVDFGSGDYNDSRPSSNSLDVMPRWRNTHWNPTRFCPEANNEVLYLSNTRSTLKDKIDALSVSQTTSLDTGALVGLKTLSPKMKGQLKGDQQAKHPAAYDSGTMKALIFMTDGEATDYDHPRPGCDTADDLWVQVNRYFGYWYDCSTKVRDDDDVQTNFTAICDAAKAEGIMVYTIGFQINRDGESDDLLADCATSASTYYYVESTDISTAFKSIAASINGVRLTL